MISVPVQNVDASDARKRYTPFSSWSSPIRLFVVECQILKIQDGEMMCRKGRVVEGDSP